MQFGYWPIGEMRHISIVSSKMPEQRPSLHLLESGGSTRLGEQLWSDRRGFALISFL
jgi:hypothetical protein